MGKWPQKRFLKNQPKRALVTNVIKKSQDYINGMQSHNQARASPFEMMLKGT